MFGLAKATPDRAGKRVESRKTVEIPPKSEANLVLYSDLADYNGSWVTKPKRLKEALLVARTLVADRGPAVVIRLVNLSSKLVVLEEGEALCELEEITNTPTPLDEGGEDAHLKEICDRVDPSVSKEDLGRLEQLMRQYQHVFSRGPFDMGLTDLVTHEIKTGGNRPIRQGLRPQPLAMIPAIDQHLSRVVKGADGGVSVDEQSARESLRDRQLSDPDLREIYALKLAGSAKPDVKQTATWSGKSMAYIQQWDRIVLENQQLHRLFEESARGSVVKQLVVPRED